MPFVPVNPIDTPYGQFVYNYTHPRKLLCLFPLDTSHGGQDNLKEARTDVRSIPDSRESLSKRFSKPCRRQGYINIPFSSNTRAIWDVHRNFEPRSDDEDSTWHKASPSFHTTPTGGRLDTTYHLTCSRTHTRRIFGGVG
ncbi:hypothetical protein AVEN_167671-1 [Araneus ventricosus]|uniref:Uncharacterized protein n=1 Tax=Araneus ventricosus TaxID=182803 RepID=A0A4Y2NBS5_ARAVE|nr:hypothetical protein AVEN_167671-1 [Araneus ventricosus]